MNELMSNMITLNSIDRRIVAGKTRLGELSKEIAIQEKRIEEVRDKSRKIEAAIKDKAFSTDRVNMDIRTAEAEVLDQEWKIKNIKNQREYRIVSDRIKELKIIVDENESTALAGMEELDRLREQMNASHTSIGEEELKLTSVRQKAQEEADRIKARHAALLVERQEAVKKVEAIDTTAYQAYDFALKRTKGDPMAEMTMDGICQSCFRRQNSNVLNIVHIGIDIKNCRCQGCARILYVKDTAGEDAAS